MYKFTIWYNLHGCGYDLKKTTKVATVVAESKEEAIRKICKITGENNILVVKYDFEEIIEQIKGVQA